MFGPRYLDEAGASSVSAKTLAAYRRGTSSVVAFLDENGWAPSTVEEWDDLLVEFSQSGVSIARYREAYAGMEFYFVRLKGHLAWSKRRLDDMASGSVIRHTVPACYELCLLLAAAIASMGRPRIAAGILVQYELGLRPGELAQLIADDIGEGITGQKNTIIIKLGTASRGTKSGREQYALMFWNRHPAICRLLLLIRSLAPRGLRLFPFSVATLGSWLRKAQISQQLELGVTPHSPRSGFASDLKAEGVAAVEVKERGRWVSEASFRAYVDLVGAQAVSQRVRLSGRAAAAFWIERHLEDYFPAWSLLCYDACQGAGAGGSPWGLGRRGHGRGRSRGITGAGGRSGGRGRAEPIAGGRDPEDVTPSAVSRGRVSARGGRGAH